MIWVVIIMVAIAVGALYVGIFRQKSAEVVDRTQQNISILRQQLADLKHQHAAGDISDADFQRSHDELALALQADIGIAEEPATKVRLASLHSSRVTALIILLCIGITTPALYYKLGSPEAINLGAANQAEDPHQNTGHTNEAAIEVMVQRLEKKMQSNPENTEGWYMLGRSYMVLRKYDQAVKALEHAFKLSASDPDVLVSYADALAMHQGSGITGKSFMLVKQALELDPNHKVALWLTAMGYETEQNYKKSLELWQKLLPQVQTEPAQYAEVQNRLQNAATKAGVSVALPAPAKPVGKVQLTVNISLPETFRQKLKGTETVFVFARAAKGPPQPLAAKRMLVSQLPATVLLDDSMAMMPTNKLSDHKQVYVGARVSRSGNPMAAAGDIQGRSQILDLGKTPQISVQLVLDHEVL